MKKLTALLMTICMLVICLGTATAVSAETEANKLLFADDFSGDLTNWICKADTNPAIDKNIPETLGGSNTTDVLWVWGDASFGYNLTTPITEGKVVFSFDVDPNKMASYDDISERAFMAFIGGENVTSENVSTITTSNVLGALSIFKPESSTSSEFRRGWQKGFAATDPIAISAAGYRHVDIVVDMGTRYAYTYLDNVKMGTGNPLPEAFTSVNSLMFANYLNLAGVFLDNVEIVQNPTMELEDVNVNEGEKYIDLVFNRDIISAIPAADKASVWNAATGERVAVTAVTSPSANVIRASFADELLPGGYKLKIDGAIEAVGAEIDVNTGFDVAIATIAENFDTATALPSWLRVNNTANTTTAINDGVLRVTHNSAEAWQTVIQMNTTAVAEFANIYKAIRSGGTDGGTFTAGTTQLGALSYEFDLKIETYGGTVVLYGKDRNFRINTWTSQGFHAGNSNNLGLYRQNENHKIKLIYNFDEQRIKFFIDGEPKAEYLFTELTGESQNITGQDVFNLYFGISDGCTAVFDNLVIKYTAADCLAQDIKLTGADGEYTLTGSVVNPFTSAKPAAAIFAVYNGNTLVSSEAFDATTAASYQNIINKTFKAPSGVEYDSVKLFLWKDMSKLQPMCTTILPQ